MRVAHKVTDHHERQWRAAMTTHWVHQLPTVGVENIKEVYNIEVQMQVHKNVTEAVCIAWDIRRPVQMLVGYRFIGVGDSLIALDHPVNPLLA
jgi:hypothetical protein